MVILRAFPLSLSIYWRMLLVFPVIILALAVLGGLAGLLTVVLSVLLPTIIVAVLVFAFCMSFFTTPLLVGMRMGLTALDHGPRNTYAGLWGYAMMYGLVLALLTTIITAIGLVIFGLVFGGSTLSVAMMMQNIVVAQLTNPVAFYSGIFIINLIPFCVYAALMLPMAASSIGKDTNGERHTPFAGFGQGFVPVMVLMVLAQIANVIAAFAITYAFVSFTGATFLSNTLAAATRYNGGELPRGTATVLLGLVLPYLLFALWTISLQCAGAVRIYADAVDTDQSPPSAPPTPAQTDDGPTIQDVGAMWRNRMPKTQ